MRRVGSPGGYNALLQKDNVVPLIVVSDFGIYVIKRLQLHCYKCPSVNLPADHEMDQSLRSTEAVPRMRNRRIRLV